MSSPKKNVAYEFDIGLIDSADTGSFKANPTIAAGDFKVSTDNSALANLSTLPVVDPAGSAQVKINLSQSEMNGDKIVVHCIDAAGDEWDDVLIFIDATVANVDDIVRSTTPANTLNVDGNNRIDVGGWLGTAVTVSATTSLPEVDAKSISDSLAAADSVTEARLSELAAANLPADVDTLLARLTVTRANLLDNIPAGLMPTQAEVLSIQNNTRTTIGIPTVAERPDAGSTRLKIYLNNYDTVGNMEAPDSAPTVAVENESGTTRNGNLQHPTTHVPQTTMVNLSVGRYWIEYDLDNADALESLTFTFSIIEGGVTRIIDRVMLVVDTTAVDFTAADRTKLDTLHDTRLTAARAANLDEITAVRLAELDAANLPTTTDDTLTDTSEIGAAGAGLTAITGVKLAVTGLDLVLVDGKALTVAMEIIAAVVAGKISGAGSGIETFVGLDAATDRVVVTVDSEGNRSAVTYP